MSSGEKSVRDSMRSSVHENHDQMLLAQESRDLLVSVIRTEVRDELRIAFAEGLEAVLTSEKVWAKVFAVMQQQAAERTGRFFLDGAMAGLKKLAWLGLFALIAYALGGWALVKVMWTAYKATTSP